MTAALNTTYTLVESPSAAVEHLPTAVSRSLYRVAQESLANVRRHSTATKVTVVLRVDERATGGYAELEVTDDGPGIAEALRNQVFEPFFTTHSKGTGLGLYIARELADANGAVLELGQAEAGGLPGAHFRLTARSRS